MHFFSPKSPQKHTTKPTILKSCHAKSTETHFAILQIANNQHSVKYATCTTDVGCSDGLEIRFCLDFFGGFDRLNTNRTFLSQRENRMQIDVFVRKIMQ